MQVMSQTCLWDCLQKLSTSCGFTIVSCDATGYREADDPELARWANKQRQEHKQKSLGDDKTALLQELAFEFDEDEAEWLRWFLELAR